MVNICPQDANTTNELSLLSTCLDSLFANTQKMEDHAIVHAIKALRTISNEALKNNKEPGKVSILFLKSNWKFNEISTRSLFGASKMVEIAIHNVTRIHKIWDIILEHFTMLSNHKVMSTCPHILQSIG